MNIIINGGTRGIGLEVVNLLAQDASNQILATGRNVKVLKSLSDRFKNVNTLSIDLSASDGWIKSLKTAVYGNFRSVDILINIAGMLVAREFADISNDEAHLMMETNFFGPASVIRVIKPLMPSGSHIINISSMGGFQGSSKFNGLSYYSASKAALACLTECLATEFAESGVRVNCLALGAVKTEMLEEAFPGYHAPVDAKEMAEYICNFAKNGHRVFNGKILPVAVSNP